MKRPQYSNGCYKRENTDLTNRRVSPNAVRKVGAHLVEEGAYLRRERLEQAEQSEQRPPCLSLTRVLQTFEDLTALGAQTHGARDKGARERRVVHLESGLVRDACGLARGVAVHQPTDEGRDERGRLSRESSGRSVRSAASGGRDQGFNRGVRLRG